MKKIKGQEIEYLITRAWNGQIIRAYQIDSPGMDSMAEKSMTVPILVDYMGAGESLVEILEERKRLQEENIRLKEELEEKKASWDSYWIEAIKDIQRQLKAKRWWQFWK